LAGFKTAAGCIAGPRELFCSDSPRRPCIRFATRGGAQGVERSMTKADEFREYAGEALRWSCQSSTEEEKKALIDLAVTWTQAASLSERTFVGPLRA
jgi:hypothetical protein